MSRQARLSTSPATSHAKLLSVALAGTIMVLAFGVVAYRLALPSGGDHRTVGPSGVTTTSLPVFGSQEVNVDPVTLRLPTEWFLVRDSASHPGWDLLPTDGPSAAVVKSHVAGLSRNTVLFAMDADLSSGSSLAVDVLKSPGTDLQTTLQGYRVALMQPGYTVTSQQDLNVNGSAHAHRFDVQHTLPGSLALTYVIVIAESGKGTVVVALSTLSPARSAGTLDGIVGTLRVG